MAIAAMLVMTILRPRHVYANPIRDSVFVKGMEKMLNDATSALLILVPIVATLLVTYLFMRKGAADDMDQKKWHSRITIAIACSIAAMGAVAIINIITGYFT